MLCPSNLRADSFCSREHPALLVLPLSNGYLMVSRVNRSDSRSLPTLNKWCSLMRWRCYKRAILIMWLAEVLLLTIETGENLGMNTDPDFQFVASVFSR